MDITQKAPFSFNKVLMIPWLAHGHVSPYLELAKLLSNTNIFYVYFCSTPIILKSIEENVQVSMHNVQLVELHLPLEELPPHLHTSKGLPPHLRPTLLLALETAIPNLSTILDTVNPDLIIYDINQPWIPTLASSREIPSVHFQTSGATGTSFFYRLFKRPQIQNPFPAIFLKQFEFTRINSLSTINSVLTKSGYSDEARGFTGFERSCDIILVKSSRALEAQKIYFLSKLLNKKIVPVGPLIQAINTKEEESEKDSKMFEWLNKKKDSSTIFVSFGSEYYLTKEEIEEIAHGLELSNVNFIWVIRFPIEDNNTTSTKIDKELPKGFLEKVKEKSMIMEGWAPQSKILKHPSIGGFVSHCGWSSVMESISYGVPIIAMPMQLDQPLNARLLVENGVALEVNREESGELRREEVARVIRELFEKKNGEEIKRKAKELSEIMSMNKNEEISYMIKELVELCQKNKA